ncbi:TetR/AcrR family transcriptional regulator [Roseburia sp. 499]|uniref:TetR/AcrR family transcriptional regulator n=1 Tax=Roseburia sp. 499 TaxID=1261634 RepID=UPI00095146E1|nr:TetR/AcrR family transcriptional regulator [Roseburia sp. 499]WVK71154.1 TetR/AcrR family transcriptional regulator [Roseburia sp. 499]
MRTRTFSEEEKKEIKQKMKEVGMPMLKEQGLIHMSISKLANAVGIGKSTFYSFYPSKEEFVEDMLADNRKQLLEDLQAGLQGRERYSIEESKAIVRKMVMDADNIYQNFSSEDEAALKKMYEKRGVPFVDLEKEKRVIEFITSMMDGVKKNLDYAVIANIIKIIVLSYEQKEMLHESGVERTMDIMVDLLIDSIFEM